MPEIDPLDIQKTLAPDVARGIPASRERGTRDGATHADTLQAGTTLGQYRIVRLLGRGGMGEVYEVEHTVLRRRYALKLLPADFASRPGALERFKREAQAMANLDHPNIVKVDEFGETDNRHWLRMELAEGGQVAGRQVASLAEYADAKGGRIDPDQAQIIFTQILGGLAHAHEHGVVHRDLKPANILIFGDGNAERPTLNSQRLTFNAQRLREEKSRTLNTEHLLFKIADFGLVRMVGEEWLLSQADNSIRLSMSLGGMATEMPSGAGSSTRSLIGTYEYMSPEQKRGEDATEASDVYAVGLMMYRLLTGRELGMKRPSELVPGLDRSWDNLLLTALDETPSDRFADAGAMLAGLRDSSASPPGERISPTPPPVPRRHLPVKETEAAELKRAVDLGGGVSLELACVPPGTFMMGAENGEGNERPVHEVRISRGFWMGKYPVTQGQWEQVMGSNPSHFKVGKILGFGGRSQLDHPVETVSWDDAVEFCRKLTERERQAGRLPDGGVYRLPTEAEWEYACRAGTTGDYAGNLNEMAWYDKNSGGKTHQVGTKKANAWGLHDMHGNVWEWCQDWYGDYPAGAATDPSGPRSGSYRVLRGGSWYYCARYCRSAGRSGDPPGVRHFYVGFRLLRAVP